MNMKGQRNQTPPCEELTDRRRQQPPISNDIVTMSVICGPRPPELILEPLLRDVKKRLGRHGSLWLPNGSRLSCGRLTRRRKGAGRSPMPPRARHNGFLQNESARQLQAHVRQPLVELAVFGVGHGRHTPVRMLVETVHGQVEPNRQKARFDCALNDYAKPAIVTLFDYGHDRCPTRLNGYR